MPIAKFLPPRRSDRVAYLRQVADKLVADFADYGILEAVATAFEAKVAALEADAAAIDTAQLARKAATSVVSDPGGSEDVAVTALRALGNQFRSTPAVTDESLAAIGMSRRDDGATPVAAPGGAPEFAVESIAQGTVNIRFRTAGAANPRARAPGSVGVQIAVVDGAALAAPGEADAARQVFVSRSPNALDTTTFPNITRLYARWQTARGLVGPWSDAVTFRRQI